MRHPRSAAAAVLSLLLAALLPAAVAAHSELVSSNPADGALLTVAPREITGEFSEGLDATRSVMELRAAGRGVLATGRVPADGPPTRMAIIDLAVLDPGTYEVRWTTVTADDAGVERGTFAFTVVPTSRPSASPTPESSNTPAPTTPPPASPAAPTAMSAPATTSVPSPAPSPAPGSGAGSSTGDLLVPLAVLAGILFGSAAWLLRRRR